MFPPSFLTARGIAPNVNAGSSSPGLAPGLGGTAPGNAATNAQLWSLRDCLWPLGSNAFNATVTGSGSTIRQEHMVQVRTGSTSGSTAIARSQGPGNFGFTRAVALNSGGSFVDWSRVLLWRFLIGGRGEETANGVCRFSFGKSTSDGVGDLTRAGWQIKITGTGAGSRIRLGVHNGTTFVESAEITALNGLGGGWDVKPVVVRTLGNGTAELYYGDAALTLAAPSHSMSGAPTGAGILGGPCFSVEVSNGADSASNRADIGQLSTRVLT